MQLVIFSLQDKLYGMPSVAVEEITGAVSWTAVPKAPKWLLGLINLRGNVISLLHYERFMNIEDKTQDSEKLCYNNTIIIKHNGKQVALAVDKVHEVIDISEEEVQLPVEGEGLLRGVFSRNDVVISLIRLSTLFSKNEGSN